MPREKKLKKICGQNFAAGVRRKSFSDSHVCRAERKDNPGGARKQRRKIGRKAFGPYDRKTNLRGEKFMRLLNFIGGLREQLRRSRFERCMSQAAKIVADARAQAPQGFDPQNAETLIADVFVPQLHWSYVLERTAELHEFIQSGVTVADPEFSAAASGPGRIATMPFWKDLTGADEVINDTTSLTTAKMGSGTDSAVIHNRAKAWSDNDLASILATGNREEILSKVIELQAEYWERRMQAITLSTLSGIFASAGMSTNSHDIYSTVPSTFGPANYLNAESFIRGRQKMGDAKSKLVAIAMHSDVETNLEINDLIDFIPQSDGKPDVKMFRGFRVIVDDGMTVQVINNANVYSSYLFGAGALAYGPGTVGTRIRGGEGTWEVEFGRVILAGQNVMATRRRFVLHMRGVKYLDNVCLGPSPTNTELQDGTNWNPVFEPKNIRVIRIRHNVDLT